MILEVQDRKYRVLFKHDEVYAVRKIIWSKPLPVETFGITKNAGNFYKPIMRKMRKQPMKFIKHHPFDSQDYNPVDQNKKDGTVSSRKRITAFIEDITDTDDPEKCPRVEGQAVCSPKDRYCKEKGRRIAFAKAAQEIFNILPLEIVPDGVGAMEKFDKEFRFEFWLQYFGVKGDYKSIEKSIAAKRKSWKLTIGWEGKRLKCKLLSNKRIVPVTVEWNGSYDYGDGRKGSCNEELLKALNESLKCSCGEDLWYIDVNRGDLHVPKGIAEYIRASELKQLVELAKERAVLSDKAKEVNKNKRIPEEDRCPHSDGEDWPCPMKKEIPKSLEWCKANCPIRHATECVKRGLEMEIQRIASFHLKEKP